MRGPLCIKGSARHVNVRRVRLTSSSEAFSHRGRKDVRKQMDSYYKNIKKGTQWLPSHLSLVTSSVTYLLVGMQMNAGYLSAVPGMLLPLFGGQFERRCFPIGSRRCPLDCCCCCYRRGLWVTILPMPEGWEGGGWGRMGEEAKQSLPLPSM